MAAGLLLGEWKGRANMSNLFGRADFSRDSAAKEKIYQKMLEAGSGGKIVGFSTALDEEELRHVTAAEGLPAKSRPKKDR